MSGEKKITVPAEATESFELDISFDNGESCNIVFTYPKGRAMTAIHAINKMSDTKFIGGLLHANQHDPSVAEALEKAGLGFADDDDDDELD